MGAKCSVEKLYTMITRDAPEISKYVPKMVHNVEVLPGNGEVRVGSIFVWDYIHGDKASTVTFKENRLTKGYNLGNWGF
ncbi:hypothetical protein MKW98_005895 [Papaver atlanticum]|uniref:Bet v I/Major latex protein domain-containing protein n=1 Tax=Papaver atlanticum TaxID=357466 RepID=A0AAD4TE03_9MAGN|nr:hypothetical protein MKW98_005895 [Papaver atlanticum]